MKHDDAETEDLIRDYLAGRLSEADAAAFEARYFLDDALAEELDLALHVRAAGQPPPIRLPPLAATFSRGDQVTLRGVAEALALTVEATGSRITLSWPPVEGVDVYRVQVFGTDGAVVVDVETEGCAVDHGGPAGVARVQALDALRAVLADTGLVQLGGG